MRPRASECRGRGDCAVVRSWRSLFRGEGRQQGYVLILGMLVITALLMLGGVVAAQVQVNQQHVQRDRAYSQSLAIAEAGLNQYLWMVATGMSGEMNGFTIPGAPAASPRKMTFVYSDPYDGTPMGDYTMEVTPPQSYEPNVTVKVTGRSNQPVEQSRTITARVGRPSFSEFIMLTDQSFNIAGPLEREWFGRTHSNGDIKINTWNINSIISAVGKVRSDTSTGWPAVPNGHSTIKDYWRHDQHAIPFDTVTADLTRLSAIGNEPGGVNLPYTTKQTGWGAPSVDKQGWYIKLLPNEKYQLWRVTNESQTSSGSGGSLTRVTTGFPAGFSNQVYDYPENGLIFVNDNVWVEGTDLDGRITIASSGQMNPKGKQNQTSIKIVGDLTYSAKDGTVAVGLIAQGNIEIPSYAPLGKTAYNADNPRKPVYDVRYTSMEINMACIAQKGKQFVNAADIGGPSREHLTVFGSVSSCLTPYRVRGKEDGFRYGSNSYDPFLLHNPPPHFPTIGTYQIMDWRELPASEALDP